MMFYEFEVDNKVYNLRLNTRTIVALEKQLGCNPLSIFGAGNRIPTVTEMVNVLHQSLTQYNHGITLNDAYDIFDKFIAENHTAVDFIPIVIEIYKVSGLIGNEEEDPKN